MARCSGHVDDGRLCVLRFNFGWIVKGDGEWSGVGGVDEGDGDGQCSELMR